VPATSTATGDHYRITSAGTSQSKTWAIGDAAIYNGVSGSWTQLPGYYSGHQTLIDDRFNAWVRDTGYIYSDGTTANRAQIQGPFFSGTRGWLAGAAAATWRGRITVPSSAPSGTAYVAGLASASGSEPGILAHHIDIRFGGNALTIRADGASVATDLRLFNHSTFRTIYSGQTGTLEVYLVQGTTNPVVRWNGVDISAGFAASTNGTPPAWLDTALVSTYHTTGYNWPAGPAPLGCWILGALSDAERTYWDTTGTPPAWVSFGGSTVTGVPSARAFSLGSTDANVTTDTQGSSATVTSEAGARDGGAGSFFIRIAQSATTAGRNGSLTGMANPTINFIGGKVQVRFWIRSTTGIAGPGIVVAFNKPFGAGAASAGQTIVPTGSWVQYILTFELTAASGSWLTFSWAGAGGSIGDSIDLDDVELFSGGALSLPSVQSTYIDDVTSIGQNIATLTGMLPIAPTGRVTTTTLKAYAEPIFAQRLGSDQIISDGATSNRSIRQTPGARGNVAGAAVAALRLWVPPMATNPAATCWLAIISSDGGNGIAHRLEVYINTSGLLSIEAVGAVNGDRRSVSISGFRSGYLTNGGFLELKFATGTTNPSAYFNDVDISTLISGPTVTGTPPNWLDSSLNCTTYVIGLNWPAGPAPVGCWINASLTDAERTAWRTTGKPPAWVAFGGSQVLEINSDFSAGVDSWSASNGAVVGNVDSIGGVDNVLELNTGGGTSAAANRGFASSIQYGAYIRLRFDVYRPSANTTGVYIGIRNDNSALTGFAVQPVADTWTSYDLTIPWIGGGLQFRLSVAPNSGGTLGTGDKAYFKNVKANRVGAISLPGVQPIPVIDDWTTIGGNCARLVGMTPTTQKRDWRIVTSTATSGNQQLLGGSVFIETNRHRIDSWVINNLGTSKTVSLGNASAGTQYASGITAAAGLNDVTLATRFNATVDLWANSNGTDQLVHTITGHRVGNA